MKMRIDIFALLITIVLYSDGASNKSRKHYGLSFHAKCQDYIKTFTCMSACKSIGFQVFRLDFRCKCSCHTLRTTTLVPFFKWQTNGTTKKWAKTQSPQLYHVVGTLSPPTYFDYDDDDTGSQTTAGVAGGGGNSTDTAGVTGDKTTGGGAGGTSEAADAGGTGGGGGGGGATTEAST